jgi:c-di-GMP-binding flagellar brake protein YcgR
MEIVMTAGALKFGDGEVIACDWTDEDRRAYERYAAESYLRVTDMDGEPVGELVDISPGGFMMLAKPDRHLTGTQVFAIVASFDSQLREPIIVTARNAWVREADECGERMAGFQFFNLTAESCEQLAVLLTDLGASTAV